MQVYRVRSLGGDPPVGDGIPDELHEEGGEGENAQYGNIPIYAFSTKLLSKT